MARRADLPRPIAELIGRLPPTCIHRRDPARCPTCRPPRTSRVRRPDAFDRALGTVIESDVPMPPSVAESMGAHPTAPAAGRRSGSAPLLVGALAVLLLGLAGGAVAGLCGLVVLETAWLLGGRRA